VTVTPLARPHLWRPGRVGPPLLLLHGTGGDETSLLPYHEQLAPDAPVLAVRGTVSENGLNRYFRRFAEGVFDEVDLVERVGELVDFLAAAESHYGMPPGQWMAVGFSNGANIAAATLMLRPAALAGAVLMAAMVPFRDGPPYSDLTGKHAIVVNGVHDPMATAEQTSTLVAQLRALGARVDLIPHNGGHEIDETTLPLIAGLIANQ
jgi:phospholipase/carboxylesterase